jgi:hypothetical protein
MNASDIRSRIKAEPFEPFTLHLADGGEFRVEHPEFMAMEPEGRRRAVLFFPERDGRGIEIIDPMLVTSITVGDEPPQSSNGAA